MAENINDGGRAFPVHPGSNPDGGNAGMSLRDWFAGQALVGGMAAADGHNFSTAEKCAVMAYSIADAMLAAREAR